MKTNVTEKIALLRQEMKQLDIAAYIIPSSDPHLSEYPAQCWKSREWISGFTGSAGTVVVTQEKAGLWTDSRYFLQAANELAGSGIELYKSGLPETPTIQEFLLHTLQKGQTAGLDGNTYSASDAAALSAALGKKGIFLDTTHDLILELWKDRPSMPGDPFFILPETYSGMPAHEKLIRINNKLQQAGADCTILCALDEIAWTFNIRGNDVAYNPVVISYAFISEDESVLFVQPGKLHAELAEELKKEGVILADYSRIKTYLSGLKPGTSVLVDKNKTNAALFEAIPSACRIMEAPSPVAMLKAVKNET